MRVFICEPSDPRVQRGAAAVADDLRITTLTPRRGKKIPPESHQRYLDGIRSIKKNRADVVLAGAGIALSEFLSLLFAELGASRPRKLLYSVAPMETSEGPFVLVDPCVVIDPKPEELAVMARGAAKLYQAIYARTDTSIAVLSHSTGGHSYHRDVLAARTVAILKKEGSSFLSEALLQVDAALSPAAARRKAAALVHRPSVLVCTGVGVANAIYKTIEVFGRSRVKLAGAILVGLDQGLVGLLPRTCTEGDVSRLLVNAVRALRGAGLT